MENNLQTAELPAEERSFPLMKFLSLCLAQWKWFIISVIFFVGVGYLYNLRQIPLFSRTMQVLVQDTESGGMTNDITNAFKGFGLGGASTNVYNELVSLKSPAVMQEVVKRLNLTVSISEWKLPHQVPKYGQSAPVDAKFEGEDSFGYAAFKMDLNPDDTYVLHSFRGVNKAGENIRDNNKRIKGRVGFTPVKTPVGNFVIAPNGQYTNNRTETVTYVISALSEHSAIEYYTSILKADLTDADSEVIDLTIIDSSVKRAEDILNTVVEVYNEFWVRDKNRMAVATSEFISDRLTMLTKELGEVDTDIADYQSAHHMPDVEQTSKMYLEESMNVSRGLIDARNQLAMAKYMRDYVSNPANAGKVIPVLSGVGNSGLESLVKDYNSLMLTRENLIQNSSEDNPIVETYTTQANGMRESIIRSANSYVGTLEANVRGLEGAQNANQSQLASAPTQAKYLGSIMRDQAIKEQLYLFLLQKREENDLSQAFNAYNTRIITPPFGKNEPVSPKTTQLIMVSLFLGLFLPAGIIYFVQVCDTKVRSRKDLENMPIPFIGEIPQIGRLKKWRKFFMSKKARQKEIDTPKPIVAEGKRDVPNEAFRVVRSNIDLMLGRNAEHSVIAVTSFNPGSGKSFTAFNLGASFALKRKKVLLIDGDLRHGSLSGYVGSPTRGLASFLTGKTEDVSKITYPVKDSPGLNVIPIGKRPPNPAELLEGPRFGELIDMVRNEYDIIMIDCPPINVVVDTQLVNKYADCTLFVVRAGLLERSAIADLTRLYNEKRLKRMSMLLNGTETAHSSYYTYGNYQSLEE